MRPLFTFGDLVLDVVATVDDALDRDTDTPGEVRSVPGGSAANFAVWTRRLGDPVRFAARLGDDLLGHALRDDMAREGVEPFIAMDPQHPTAVLVLFSQGTQRHMMVPSGANHFLDEADIPDEAVRGAGWLHVTGYSFFWAGTKRAVQKAIRLAREAGVPISLDPSSAGFIRRHGLEIPEGVEVLIPNQEECLTLTGQTDIAAAARQLGERVPLVAVKLGADGALLCQGGRLTGIPPVAPDSPVVDTTGAGDAWGAAFIHGLRHGLQPEAAAQRANRIGSRLVTRIGARPEVPLD